MNIISTNTDQEFTFPIITSNNNNNVVHLTVLPSLWKISSIKADEHQNGNIGIRKRKIINITRHGSEENGTKLDGRKAAAEEEEKMDELWEDFNEELSLQHNNNNNNPNNSSVERIDSSVSTSSEVYYDHQINDDFKDHDVDEEIGELKMECGIMSLIPKKKKNLELMGKMLKKLFLLHNIMATNK